METREQRIRTLSPKEYGSLAKGLNRVGVIRAEIEYRSGSMYEANEVESSARRACSQSLEKQAAKLSGDFLVMHNSRPHDERHGSVTGVISRRATVFKIKEITG